MVADVQLHEGARSTSSPRSRRWRRTRGRSSGTTAATPRAPRWLETAERLTDVEKEPATQQYLLLVGGLRTLAEGGHDPALVLDAFLLRSLAVAGWAPSFEDCARCGAAGPAPGLLGAGRRRRSARTAARPARPRPRRTPSRCWPRCWPATGRSPTPAAPRDRREGSGLVAAFLQWHLERGCARCAWSSAREGASSPRGGRRAGRPARAGRAAAAPLRRARPRSCRPSSCPGTSPS